MIEGGVMNKEEVRMYDIIRKAVEDVFDEKVKELFKESKNKNIIDFLELYDKIKAVCASLTNISVFRSLDGTPTIVLEFSSITVDKVNKVDEIMLREGFNLEKITTGKCGYGVAIVYTGGKNESHIGR